MQMLPQQEDSSAAVDSGPEVCTEVCLLAKALLEVQGYRSAALLPTYLLLC